MKTRWISLIVLLVLTLAGCGGSYQAGEQGQDLAPAIPKEPPSEKPPLGSSESSSSLQQLPAPTVGSVVITNTTATPISSANSASALTPDQILQSLAQRAGQDLANRLKVDVDQVDFLKIVPAKWPYDNLGCPSPNEENIDTSTPGYQILLSASGQIYMYHTDGKEWIGLCTIKPPNEIRTLP